MNDLLSMIQGENGRSFLASYSALDAFFRIKEPGAVYINTECSLVSLARLFDNLQYPGLPFEDAALVYNNCKYIFRCLDKVTAVPAAPFTAMKLLYDMNRDVFIDPEGIYPDIRSSGLTAADTNYPFPVLLMEAARMISRYHYRAGEEFRQRHDLRYNISIDEQRELLVFILSGKNTEKGFTLLRDSGFLEQYWPEIQRMVNVKQTKDYHPEGDVWNHTMETFQYRKKMDLTLSLALLFHDIGKPVANGTLEKPFDGHSELGAGVAAHFLGRLRFPQALIRNVCFLIKYHMLPFALKKLPVYRTEKVMDSPLFPLLLELYRADSSSSFIGPDGYYEACRVYRNYLKNKKNPYKNNLLKSCWMD